MNRPEDIVKSLAQQQTNIDVLEKPMKLGLSNQSLHIGIPKATTFNESRVPLTPEAVKTLMNRGNEVWVEAGAGEKANFTDNEYSEAGAKIVYEPREIFKAHIVVKMSPITKDELEFIQPNQFILSPIHLPEMKDEIIDGLLKKQAITLAFEYIKDEVKNFPIVHALSEIAGRASVLIAGELMNSKTGGNGLLLGGVSGVRPAKVIILGAGTVGESCARVAIGLGADVKIFDNNIYKLRRLQNNLSTRLFTSIINPELLEREMQYADLVIGAIHSKIARTPIIVSEEMIQNMLEGSVVMDISIDQGGVFATSETTSIKQPTFQKFGITHYCVPNITSMYPRTSSRAISNILSPLLLEGFENGGFETLLSMKKGLRKGVYTYKGRLTNQYLSERFKRKFTDLELLIPTVFGI